MTSIYEKYNVKPVINVSGRMTKLGVSTPHPQVRDAVSHALGEYFEMADLVDKTGEYIASLLNVEAALVVSCASAGIAQTVAAVITKDNKNLVFNLHSNKQSVPREIVIPKGHNVNFGAPVGTMIGLGGGTVVEAGWGNECSAEQLAMAITPNTAAIMFVKSAHSLQKSVLSAEQAVAVAKANNVPIIVDAAAEVDLRVYYEMGAELVIYSGAKAIEGPTSGLVLGKKQYIDWVKLQSQGIGRAMKIGKEGIIGLTVAIERYLQETPETGAQMSERLQPFLSAINDVTGLHAAIIRDDAGRDIVRAEITIDPDLYGHNALAVAKAFQKASPAVYFREYHANEGRLEVDVRSVNDEQLAWLAQIFKDFASGE
ncbi:DgaE family pyridoxal phosphate-dependent ammonia lyase [Bartonella sp. HY406]|uniref:DgaE family pyridoxal phosphate-dependent ammonia lyase n=1 Tax=Bartonella sp. HY406 TaxID=2979331 RepID=UPI0021C591D0|nr:DgaE family pyridoxal phosphate-dependent ammonia lyase [Bartonella sp. HY406]UXN05051.1 DgaE family pyridoxal phosphate-dependent ammonia lyase [Bartonella sp. HY406]